jgi:hypothetical protein
LAVTPPGAPDWLKETPSTALGLQLFPVEAQVLVVLIK